MPVASVAVEEALLVLKLAFLVLLYLFIWRIVRSAAKDVRMPQESFVLAPGSVPGLGEAQPIESRFLFVDVAALRAKQLRRGARPRLGDQAVLPHKAERVAMEEVKRGLVFYDVAVVKLPTEEAEP